METKHTPGPWIQSATLIYAPGETGGNICALSELRKSRFIQYDKLELGSKDWDEQMANGQLITAAPELLDALEDAMRWFGALEDWRGVGDPNIEMYRAAIKEATGGE